MPRWSLRTGPSSLGSTCTIKKKIYLQRNRGQWSNTSHVLHGSLFLKLLELVLAAHCGLPFHCFLPDEQEVTTDTLPSFFSIVT